MSKNPLIFLRQAQQELKKVAWPTFQETLVTSVMVIIMCLLIGAFFYCTDWVISWLIKYFL